ncbi:MAG TPA: hypothetical protein VIM19_03920 [Actinomycetes bacterium]
MTELPTAVSLAEASSDRLLAAGREAVERVGEPGEDLWVLMGLLARAQGFHEGAVRAVKDDNPGRAL